MEQASQPPTAPKSPPLDISCSRYFMRWLHEQQISLAFTTYQTHRLFLIGLKQDGRLSAFERLFDRAMGLHATPERLYMSDRFQLWQFDNILAPGQTHNGFDKLYVPRIGHTTGELDVHDVAVDGAGRVIFVNTLYSCLATLSDRYSFAPIWQPRFISRLTPEDRCHLNGLAMVEGEPRYVTSVSRSDVPSGWRERRADGGCVIDVPSNEVILTGLSMPHSPRFYHGKLWLLNSGMGDFGYADLERGVFEPVAFCPGYMRGLAFYGNCAVVGLSRPRERTFSGLPLDQRLADKDATARCGLMVIDLDTGNIVQWLQLEGVVTELYDVQVLPGVRCPMSLGFKSDEVRRLIAIDQAPSVVLHTLTPSEEPAPRPAPDQAEAKEPAAPATRYKFHVGLDVSVDSVIQELDALTFPNLCKQAQARRIAEPLVSVAASHRNQFIGLALAELADDSPARVMSLFVAPEHRKKGLGSALLAQLEEALTRRGCACVDLVYRSDWPNLAAIERMLQKRDWAPPQVAMLQGKGTMEGFRRGLEFARQTIEKRVAASPGSGPWGLLEGAALFPWTELTLQEQQAIQRRQEAEPWFPPALTPFQEEDRLEPLNSLGVRYQGQVIGWMITHRIEPDTIQYTSLFVSPDFQRRRVTSALLAEAVQRQMDSGVPNAIFQVEVKNEIMMKYVDKYLRPFLTWTESRISRKVLNRQSSTTQTGGIEHG